MSKIDIAEIIEYLQKNSEYNLKYFENMVKYLSDLCLDESYYQILKKKTFPKNELLFILFKYKENKIIKRLFDDYLIYHHQDSNFIMDLIDQHIIVLQDLFVNKSIPNQNGPFMIAINYCIKKNSLSDDDILYLINNPRDYIIFIVNDIFVWINENINKKSHNDNIEKIINVIISIHEKNKSQNIGDFDEKNKEYIVLWIKENLNNEENSTKQIIEDYLCVNNIMSSSQILIISKNKEILKKLYEKGVLLMENCKEINIITRLFTQVLDLGYVPNEDHFRNLICTREYLLKIVSQKKVFKTIQNKYQKEFIEDLINQPFLKKDRYDLFMRDKKYNMNEIDYIFSRNKREFLSYLFEDMSLENNVKLNEKHFEVMIYYNIFKSIPKLINNRYIQNLRRCFDIFWVKLKSFGSCVTNVDILCFLEIYGAFAEKENIIEQSHFDEFFQKRWFTFSDYLVKEKNIYPNSKNYEIYIFNVTDESSFDLYFEKLKLTDHHLDLACLCKKKTIIQTILNQKIQPTAKCYQSLFQQGINHNVTSDIIELLIIYGYQLTDNDILLATKNKIILHDSPFTKEFFPTEDFYRLCDLKFKPEYNNNMYKDIGWLRRMCDIARISDDYKQIKKFLKTSKLKMDFMCYAYISNSYSSNKIKDELLRMYNEL